jgi:type IV pilus assembly protein PilO
MNTKSAQLWYVAAGVVALLLLVAGWFLLVSPTQSNAADINEQAESVSAQNVQTQAKINQLKEQSKDLPAQEQLIAEVRNRIPETPALPTLIRSVADQAKASGVKLQSLTPSNPAANGALSTIPVEIKVSGEFSNVRLFVNSLETMKRSYFTGSLDIQRAAASTDSSGTENTLDATISGNVFMSTGFDAPAAAAPAAPAAAS